MVYGLLVLIFIVDMISIYTRSKVNDRAGFVLKMIASLNFLVLAAVCFVMNQNVNLYFALYLLFGLGCGFIGDWMLGYRKLSKHKSLLFALGLLFFLFGHVLYLFAFYQLQMVSILPLIILAGMIFIICIIGGLLFHFTFHRLKYFIVPYIGVISVLVAYSLLLLIETDCIDRMQIVLVIASLLFAISDALLCFIYFKHYSTKKKDILQLISSVCYFTAQILFAFSIYC